jgi:hypothetical protein
MLGAQGLWAERDLYRATPTVTRGLGFSGLIRRTAPFSRLLRNTRGCGGSILIRILMRVLVKWDRSYVFKNKRISNRTPYGIAAQLKYTWSMIAVQNCSIPSAYLQHCCKCAEGFSNGIIRWKSTIAARFNYAN